MNVLIVHAHNEPKSFNSSMKNLAREQLENQGYTVQVSDLYEMRFNPVATGDDIQSRLGMIFLSELIRNILFMHWSNAMRISKAASIQKLEQSLKR